MGGNSAIFAALALIYFGIDRAQPLFLDGALKLTGFTTVRTMQLLNQLCNESQDNKEMNRDACYGCFFRATSHQSGYPLLLSMANCADNYLNNTDYGHCAQYLKNTTSDVSSSINPTLVYCSFLECVRQVNKDNLNDARRILEKMQSKIAEGTDNKTVNLYEKNIEKAIRAHRALIWVGSINRRVCIIRRIPTDSNTIRPETESLDPRKPNVYD